MCNYYIEQIKRDPKILAEAASFASVAAQYRLITSQDLDKGAQLLNKALKSNLSYEGSHQYARDTQVFNQLNVDSYSKCGVFRNAESAQSYFVNGTNGQKNVLLKKLNGTGQEIDWLRGEKGQFKELLTKSELLGEKMSNAPGIDGIKSYRFNGEVLQRVSVKSAQGDLGLITNAKDTITALKKGTLKPNDTIFGVKGLEEKVVKELENSINDSILNGDNKSAKTLQKALDELKIVEKNSKKDISASSKRLIGKIKNGDGSPNISVDQVANKALNGAIVGGAISLTISAITNYIEYKNGNIDKDEAFLEVGQDTLNGLVTGAAMGAITIFIPGGPVGFACGMAIGIYISTTTQNILDEVFGKGVFGELLHATGFVYGITLNLSDAVKQIKQNRKSINDSYNSINKSHLEIESKLDMFKKIMKG